MAVLKGQQAQRLTREAIVLNMGDLTRQAARILDAARADAARIVEQAKAEAAGLCSQASQQGREQGYAAGLEQGLKEGREQGKTEAKQEMKASLQHIEQTWTAMGQDWEMKRAALHREAKTDVIRFALRTAEVVVHRVIEVDPTVCVDQVAEALECVLDPTQVTVHIHPDDRPAMREALPELMRQFEAFSHMRIVDDPSVDRGGAVVHHGEGEVSRVAWSAKRCS